MADELKAASGVRASLPQFPGATVTEQLANGQLDAQARLRPYIGDFTYSSEQASFIFHKVRAWMDRNRDELVRYMASPASVDLPDQLKLELGVEDTQQFIVACYSMATRTLGPWLSGTVSKKVYTEGEVTEPQMMEDAQARLAIFGAIKRWDEDGDLRMIFRPAEAGEQLVAAGAQAGLGMHPVVIAAIIVAVAIVLVSGAAILAYYTLSADTIERNTAMFERWCDEAKQEGDQETWRKCIELAAELPKALLKEKPDPWGNLVKYGAIVGGVYIFVVYGLPALGKEYRKTKSKA